MKKLYLFVFVLCMVNLSNAQANLFVSNGSYVFVDGDGFTDGSTAVAPVYVTDDIELADNGFIYLRDGGQIILAHKKIKSLFPAPVYTFLLPQSALWAPGQH